MSTNKKLDKQMEQLMNERKESASQLIFDKHYYELEIAEWNKVNQYIYDVDHPVWKPIVINGNETKYEVSNIGEVWSNIRHKIIKSSMNKDGYLNTTITTSERDHRVGIHRLVAIAFVPNPDNKPQVNHINGNKTLNWVGNLEWVTQQENIQHAIDTGLRDGFLGVNSPKNIYPEETIHKICKMLEDGLSQKVIADELNINKGVVNSIKRKKMWKHISCNYNIPTPVSRENPRPPWMRSRVIEMINAGMEKSDILKELGLPDDRRNRTYIRVIKCETKSSKV